MPSAITELQPQGLWKHFDHLTRIPRPSGHEAGVREHIVRFAVALGLESLIDRADNVLVRKPATKGMENRKGVILQAHLDMVPQKNADCVHDFRRDPIETFIDQGWVRARGTTLGADNGIGVAAALAVLESATLRHGPLEALFTANEEAGMTGAMGLQPGVLQGEILLNLDSEDEGQLFIGCAGGLDGTMTFACRPEPLPHGFAGFEIRVSGLKGGHSGLDIHLGRGNANKIMNRLLQAGHECCGLRLASIDGGSLRNAIPRESAAIVAVPDGRKELLAETIRLLANAIAGELAAADPGLRIDIVPADVPEAVIGQAVLERLLQAVSRCPNGVVGMSAKMEGVVETSNNLARVKSDGHRVTVECLLRSSVDASLDELSATIRNIAIGSGAACSFDGGYPGWKPDPDSPILHLMQCIYRQRFGRTPQIRAIHAGLECGIIGAAYPQLDMISFGPTIRHPHSPDEKVECASVLKFWNFLAATLEEVPKP